jgi:anti-anti-sigma regulatory factor
MTLKIQSLTESDAAVFVLSGRIREDQVSELEALFASASAGRDIILDLQDVKLVDRATVRFLEQHETRGTQLRNCPAYIREWISRERNGNSNQ